MIWVVFVERLRTNTSGSPLVSPGTTLLLPEAKATTVPSWLGLTEESVSTSTTAFVVERLTTSVVFACRSRR